MGQWMAAALLLSACSGNRQELGPRLAPDQERLIDALTLFVEAVQGDRFETALGYLAPDEKARMTDPSGQVSSAVQKQLKALRLSTLASRTGVRLEKGKLTGISAWLPNLGSAGAATGSHDSAGPLIQ